MLRQIWSGLFIFACLSLPGAHLLAQSSPTFLEGRLILRFAPEFDQRVKRGDIQVDGWEDFVRQIPGAQTEQAFPRLASPETKAAKTYQEGPNLRSVYYLYFDDQLSVDAVQRYISQHPAILYAEPWYTHQSFYQPTDARADTTGGRDFMWHLDQIMAREAWDLERNDSTVKVAIIDSGTWSEHPDLKDNLSYNEDDPIDGIDNDFDGYIDNYAGWDFGGDVSGQLIGDNQPSVGNVHGLWVTGIVGATADNELGIPGLCFNCEYLPVKAASNDNIGIISHGYQGIIYAVEQGADVINCSWGGTMASRFGEDVVNYATQVRGRAVVAACGNSGVDQAYYPAAFPWVISVANSSFLDTLFANSTFNYTVDLSAPGHNIASTFDKESYWSWGGTSAASPVVAATVALTKAHFPNLSPFQAAQRVRITSDNTYAVNQEYQDKIGSGRVNMFRALSDPAKPAIRKLEANFSTAGGSANFLPGDTLLLTGNWINFLDSSQSLNIRVEEGNETQFVEWIKREVKVGVVQTNQRFPIREGLEFRLKENLPFDSEIFFKLIYEDSLRAYSDFEYLSFVANPSLMDVDENELHSTATSFGNFGFDNITNSRKGLGVIYQNRPNALFEGGLLVADANGRVSDRIRSDQFTDSDFRIRDRITRNFDNQSYFEALTIFDDSLSPDPIGLGIRQEIFASGKDEFRNFLLLRYIIKNESPNPLPDLYAGIFTDWDISLYINLLGRITSSNAAAYSPSERYSYAYDVRGEDPGFYGVGLLSSQEFHTRALENAPSTSYSTQAKSNYLRSPLSSSTGSLGGPLDGYDIAQFTSAGPFDLFSQEEDTLVFVVMASDSLSGLDQAMAKAREFYSCTIEKKRPSENFLVETESPSRGSAVKFVDQNPGADSWVWDFGNDSSSFEASPTMVFEEAGSYEVSLRVSRGLCTQTFRQTIEIGEATSASVPLEDGWEVYPNPSKGRLFIRHPKLGEQQIRARLTNLHGQSLWDAQLVMGLEESQIELPFQLESGIYFLQLNLGDKQKGFTISLQK